MTAYLDLRLLLSGTNAISTGRPLTSTEHRGKGTDRNRFLLLILLKDLGLRLKC